VHGVTARVGWQPAVSVKTAKALWQAGVTGEIEQRPSLGLEPGDIARGLESSSHDVLILVQTAKV
jgi:hypothetical protein